MEKRIVYSTYESLHQAFKQTTAISDTNMRKAMEKLIHMFLKDELSIDSLQNSLVKVKEDLLLFKEKRDSKVTITIDSELYERLKVKLSGSGYHIRPATLLTYLTSYYVQQRDIGEVYKNHALFLLDHSESDVQHIVYGIEYRHPLDVTLFKHTEFFIDCCSETRFREKYQNTDIACDFISVLALHK